MIIKYYLVITAVFVLIWQKGTQMYTCYNLSIHYINILIWTFWFYDLKV